MNPLIPTAGDGLASAFPAVFAIVATVVVVGIIVAIVAGAARTKKIVDAGHNPLTLETDVALKVLDSEALSAPRSVAERLADADDLLAAGAISPEEHAALRSRILGTI